MDKNRLFAILSEWNFWNRPLPEYIPRDWYQGKMDRLTRSGEIIILKGIRRSGKSTLLLNHFRQLVGSGIDTREILLVNFEDPRLGSGLNSDSLEQIWSVYQEFVNHERKPYLFLDEVQNVEKWENWVLTGYELNKAQFYITGSSSRLLSKEFGTALSGRHLDITVFPLGFDEFLRFRNVEKPGKSQMVTQQLIYKKAFNEYIRMGGFPKINALEDDLKKPEMIMYYETIILKDVVARHNLKNYDNVRKVAHYLLSNIGKPLNLNKLRTSLHLSYDLAEKYFEYLKETFLLYEVNQFDFSLTKQYSNRRKVYCIDNGLLASTSFRISEDYGRYLENLVYVELKRRGLEIYFYVGRKECDFLVKDGFSIVQAIQVCSSLEHEETKTRELEGLLEAIRIYSLDSGLILTDDEEEIIVKGTIRIEVKPVWKWLLEK